MTRANTTIDAQRQGRPVSLSVRLLAALPLAGLALAFAVPLFDPDRHLPFAGPETLGLIMQMEWMAVLSGLFLVVPLMMLGPVVTSRIPIVIIYLCLAGLFGAVAYDINQAMGVLAYLALLFFSYGGIATLGARSFHRGRFVSLTIGRWACYAAMLIPLMLYFGEGGTIVLRRSSSHIPAIGFWFFLGAAVLEAFQFAGREYRVRTTPPPDHNENLPEHLKRRIRFRRTLWRLPPE